MAPCLEPVGSVQDVSLGTPQGREHVVDAKNAQASFPVARSGEWCRLWDPHGEMPVGASASPR